MITEQVDVSFTGLLQVNSMQLTLNKTAEDRCIGQMNYTDKT